MYEYPLEMRKYQHDSLKIRFHAQKTMKLSVLFLILVMLILSCADLSVEQQQEAREQAEWNDAADRENWRMCAEAYRQTRHATVHFDHTHEDSDRVNIMDIRRDLVVNGCRGVLGGYWVE